MELPNDIASCHRLILELVSVIAGFKPQLEGYIQHIENQLVQIVHLEVRVKELESQVKQSSRNSSRPPSPDIYRSKPAFPRSKGGKVGGKEGHDGGTLKMVDHADQVVDHRQALCEHCGKVHFQEPLVQLAAEEAPIKAQLRQSAVVHYDETGFYVNQERHWAHVASNDAYTHLFVHPKRGRQAHEEQLYILPNYQNWAVHDCWATYFQYSAYKHALCGAHLLRELNALVETAVSGRSNSRLFYSIYSTERIMARASCQKRSRQKQSPATRNSSNWRIGKNRRLSATGQANQSKPKAETSLTDSPSIKAPSLLLPSTKKCLLPIIRRKGIFDPPKQK